MIIQESQVAMAAVSTRTTRMEMSESFRFWRGAPPGRETGAGAPAFAREGVRLSLSGAEPPAPRKAEKSGNEEGPAFGDAMELKLQLIASLFEMLTGRKIKVLSPEDFQGEGGGRWAEELAAAQQPQEPDWGMTYDASGYYAESEELSFAAQGKVVTADGQEISFAVDMRMSRTFVETWDIHLAEGNAKMKDPLLIQYEGSAPSGLSDLTFQLDLDLDGAAEPIAAPGAGAGYLALDRNGDGAIDRGDELFGPSSGEGFAELAAHDDDGNLWIDEADAIWQGLRLLVRDDTGEKQLFTLGEKGVGAIFLGSTESPYSLTTSDHQTLGQVRRSGLFLREDGTSGTVRQIDLAV